MKFAVITNFDSSCLMIIFCAEFTGDFLRFFIWLRPYGCS